MLPKLILTDIDGVWTDGGMYYDSNGNEMKKFNTSDSAGVLFCKYLNIPIGIITGEESIAVKNRAKKLKIDYLYLGVKNKLEIATQLCNELSIEIKDVAFIGDDINDLELLKEVGISACPYDTVYYIKDVVNYKLTLKGGEGVFREFVEVIMKDNEIDIYKAVQEIFK